MYHKILVPLDGSRRAEKILPHVEELAVGTKQKLYFCRLSNTRRSPPPEGAFINLTDLEFEQAKEQAEKHLAGIQGKFREKNIETQILRHLRPGGGGNHKHRRKRGRGPDCAGQSWPQGSFQSFLRQCCRRAIASCGPSAVDYQVPEFGVIVFDIREN